MPTKIKGLTGVDKVEAGAVITNPSFSGNATVTGSLTVGGVNVFSGPYRNLIINGDMQIAQRGTSVSTPASTYGYCVDRFYSRGNSNTANTQTQSTDAPSGFGYSLNVVRDSGQTGGLIRLQQAVETRNMVYLRGKKVTLSFYAKKDSGATDSDLSVNLYTGNGTERKRGITAYDNEVAPISDTAMLTTSWQRFSFTSSSTLISDLSQLSIEINYVGVGTAPSNDGYFITGVQLEVGEGASDFEFLPYDVQLARCQRYYFKNSGTNYDSLNGVGNSVSSSASYVNIPFPVAMRPEPTAFFSNIIITDRRVYDAVVSAFSGGASSEFGAHLLITHSAVAAQDRPAMLCVRNGYSGYIAFESEL